jgi:hypothetical protein
MMEEVDVSGMAGQPADESKIPGVPRTRFLCPGCHHLEEGYPKGATFNKAEYRPDLCPAALAF